MATLAEHADAFLQGDPIDAYELQKRMHLVLTESQNLATGVLGAAISSDSDLAATGSSLEVDHLIAQAFLMVDWDAVDEDRLFHQRGDTRITNSDGTETRSRSRYFTRRAGPFVGYVESDDSVGYTVRVFPDGPTGGYESVTKVEAVGASLTVDDYCLVWRKDVVEVTYGEIIDPRTATRSANTSLRVTSRSHWARDLSASGGGGGSGTPSAPVWDPYPNNQTVTLVDNPLRAGGHDPYYYTRLLNAEGSGTITYSWIPGSTPPWGGYFEGNKVGATFLWTGSYSFPVRATDTSTGLYADATWTVTAL